MIALPETVKKLEV